MTDEGDPRAAGDARGWETYLADAAAAEHDDLVRGLVA